MNACEIKRIYEQDGRDAALEAYRAALAETPGEAEKLAFLAADFAHAEALTLLFEAGAPPAAIGDYGYTLLHALAMREESRYAEKPQGAVRKTTELLLDNKVSVLRKDENIGLACYHYAAQNGLAEMVEALAERGAKLNMTDKEGNTGIHIACDYVRHAMRNIDSEKNQAELAAKHYAETKERLLARDLSEEEIEQYVKNNFDATPEEAQRKYEAAVRLVEDYFRVAKAFAVGGVDVDEKNEHGRTALDVAVESEAKKIAAFLAGTLDDGEEESGIAGGGMTLHQAAEKGDVEAIKAIAAAGADLNELKDGDQYSFGGRTPLAVACAYLSFPAVEALLALGADPAFRDGSGDAALSCLAKDIRASLHSGVFEENRIPNIIKAMVSAGLDVNTPVNDDSDTLLILACKSAQGTGYNHRSVKGDLVNGALKHNPDLNLRNRFGETALMHACARDFDMMENVQIALLEGGADVGATDQNGDTALHYAARNDDKTGAKALCDMLLEFDADAAAVNNAGQTALEIATEQDNEPLVKLLLSRM